MSQRYVIKIVLAMERYIAVLCTMLIYNTLRFFTFLNYSYIVTYSTNVVTNKKINSDIFSE